MSVSIISKMASGDSILIASMSDTVEELQTDEPHLPPVCNHIRVIDSVKAQREDSVIGRVLDFIKNRQKPTIVQKRRESPLGRKYLNDWHKLAC